MKKQHIVYYEKLKIWYEPEAVFLSLFGEKEYTFWLDSSKIQEGLSRFSYMGEANKIMSYSLNSRDQDIFFTLSKELERIKISKTDLPFDFIGGFIGYFGYELKALTGGQKVYTSEYPDSLWYFVNQCIVFDHQKKEIYIVCLSEEKKTAQVWHQKIKKQLQNISPPQKNIKSYVSKKTLDIAPRFSKDKKSYIRNIETCKEYLKNGESYQICLTNTITTNVDTRDFGSSSLGLYKVLRKTNPAPFAAYIRHNDLAILCSSPERFLKIDQQREVESKPIKGTIKRSIDKTEDEHLANELQNSEKDRAENLMIVDLVRNDLGKVCEIGSVSVPKLMQIESYRTVHQLVSTIRGKLKKEISSIDCIKACFPGGSMTGAPKIRTMEILDELEGKARGIYSGALGFLSANGAVDLNIVIRTIIINNQKLSIGAGGAILIQSDAEKEYAEMLLKTQALIKSISACYI